MKPFILTTLAWLALLAWLPLSSGCGQGIIPNYIYEDAANNPDLDDDLRAHAKKVFAHMEELRVRRHAAADQNNGEGLTEQGGDDQDYNDEQAPGAAQELAAENQQLDKADKQTPDPAAVPPNPPKTSESNTIHRRHLPPQSRALDLRQAADYNRFIFTDYQTCLKAPPYRLARIETSAQSVDPEVNIVFEGLAIVLQFYRTFFDRNLIDGNGARVHATVHYCENLGNAFWDGDQMLFGEGDGVMFNFGSFTRSLSVTGHEVTHGVIKYTNQLKYEGQSGALNEHLADVFGILVEQWYFGDSSASSTWLIGPGLPVGGGAVRSMKAPGTAYNTRGLGKDRQTASMSEYFAGPQDDFGVHINSGIPNRAFYLFATAVGGYAYHQPGHIWYDVLNGNEGQFDYAGETFATFAQRTINAANRLYNNAALTTDLHNAWRQVGVLQ